MSAPRRPGPKSGSRGAPTKKKAWGANQGLNKLTSAVIKQATLDPKLKALGVSIEAPQTVNGEEEEFKARKGQSQNQNQGGSAVVSSSRIIVKNLPKHLTIQRFREIFSSHGEITDVKFAKLPWVFRIGKEHFHKEVVLNLVLLSLAATGRSDVSAISATRPKKKPKQRQSTSTIPLSIPPKSSLNLPDRSRMPLLLARGQSTRKGLRRLPNATMSRLDRHQ